MIVVTGGSGLVGRELVRCLLVAKVAVRVPSRNVGAAYAWPSGVEVVPADADPEAIFDGADAVFWNARAVGPRIDDLAAAAEAAGVRRSVVLSAANVDDDAELQPSRRRGDLNREVEQAAFARTIDTVALRATVFAANTIGLWAWQLRHGNVACGPAAGARSAVIDERDLARSAAAALLAEGSAWRRIAGERLVVTGPEVLREDTMAEQLGRALGRDIRYQEWEAGRFVESLIAHGFPAAFAAGYVRMQQAAARREVTTTPAVQSLTGRPPRRFTEWAMDHRAAFDGAGR